MNDDSADFEEELRRMQPARASQHLERRISAFLDAPAPPVTATPWWLRLGFNRPFAAFGWGLLSPAFTACVVLAVMRLANTEPAFARTPSHPDGVHGQLSVGNKSAALANRVAENPAPEIVRAANVLYQTQDDGVVLDGAQEPVHRVRYRSADLVQWRNPNTGVRWEVSYPREDIRLVPIHAD